MLRTIDYKDIITAINTIVEKWGEDGKRVIAAIYQTEDIKPLSMSEFLNYCTACGGNWGGMLLSGLKRIYPAVYDAIPDDMGAYAWACICSTLLLCKIVAEKEEDQK